jgi:hypothetical protein
MAVLQQQSGPMNALVKQRPKRLVERQAVGAAGGGKETREAHEHVEPVEHARPF